MTPDDYSRIRDLFDRAMTLTPGERRQFVDAHAPSGDPVRSELLAMVEAGDDSAFLANAFVAGMFDQGSAGGQTAGGQTLPLQIGNYKILRVLGRGGMGVVYLALRNDDVFQKVVALKVIGDAIDVADAGLVERFKQERQILAGLDHPNIARILDGGSTQDGRPFYVMEYVAGSPIDEYCARMNSDLPTRVRMMAQACDAIEYLHNHAIAHRDVKPANILVTLDGRVKLVDFGIAKIETGSGLLPSLTSGGEPTMIMTPGYASPEQIGGDRSGKSGDIYSVAVVLYQLLTGRLPYADHDGRPNLAAQLSGKSPDPPSRGLTKSSKPDTRSTELRKVSYPDLDRVVLTALQRDPLQRYPTVQVFAEDLRRCLDGRPIVARPASVIYSLQKLIARNRVAAALVVLVLVAGGAGVWMAIGVRMERVELQAKEAELERFVALLNSRVARWMQPEHAVPAAEKVADVQAANRVMSSDTVRMLSARAPDPPRVKQLVGELRRVLERADDVSRDQPALRKEIALVFRQIGDFEKNAPLAQLADKKEAARSYQRAATIVADIRSAERPWAEQQIAELSSLLVALGAPVPSPPTVAVADSEPVMADSAPSAPSARPTLTALPPPPPPADTPTPEPASGDKIDVAARAELRQRLRMTMADAEHARRNYELLRDSMARRGQAIRSDVVSSLTEAEALIEDARSLLEANDPVTAEDYLRRAGFQLRKVFQAVGG